MKKNSNSSWYSKIVVSQTIEEIRNKYDKNSPELLLAEYIQKSLLENNLNNKEFFTLIYKWQKDNINLENNELANNTKLLVENVIHSLLTYVEIRKHNPRNEPNGKEWKNINQIKNINELENLISKFSYILDKHSNHVTGEMRTIVDKYKIHEFKSKNNDIYEVFHIPRSINENDIFALRVLAHGKNGYNPQKQEVFDFEKGQGRWCIRTYNMARKLLSEDDFYIVYKNGNPFASLGSHYFNNVNRLNTHLNLCEWSVLIEQFLKINPNLIKEVFPEKFKELYDYVNETGESGELFIEKIKSGVTDENYVEFYTKYKIRISDKDDVFFNYISKTIDESELEKNKSCKISQDYELAHYYTSEILNSNEKEKKLYVANNEKLAYAYFIDNKGDENLFDQVIVINNKKYDLFYIVLSKFANSTNKKLLLLFLKLTTIYNEDIHGDYGNYVDLGYFGFVDKYNLKDIARKNISKYADISYSYAYDFIQKRWENDDIGKQAEITIANDLEYSLKYALNCIKGRWPQDTEAGRIAEQKILKSDIKYIYDYTNIAFSDKRWPDDEKVVIDGKEYNLRKFAELKLAKNNITAEGYAKYHIFGRWPQNDIIVIDGEKYNIGKIAEKTLLDYKCDENGFPLSFFNYLLNSIRDRCPEEFRDKIEDLIAQDEEYIFFYLLNCIKAKLPPDDKFREKIERKLSNHISTIVQYCNFCGEGRWPKDSKIFGVVELYIAQDPEKNYEYALNCIKGRWPQDEITIIDDKEYNIGQIAEMNIALNLFAYYYAANCIKGRWPQDCEAGKIAEQNIAQNGQYVYHYAKKCIKGRWPEENGLRETAEKNIVYKYNLPYLLVDYARDCIKGRWPQDTKYGKAAEEKIKFSVKEIIEYCASVLIDKNGEVGDRWPEDTGSREEVEEKISRTNEDNIYLYARDCIKGRWPQDTEYGKAAEEKISFFPHAYFKYAINVLHDRLPDTPKRKQTEEYIANNANMAYGYAKDCIKGRWPEENGLREIAEKNIIKDVQKSVEYARDVFIDKNGQQGDRWPQNEEIGQLAEMNIAKNDEWAYKYALNCIKGRWPQDTEAGRIAEQTMKNSYYNYYYNDYKRFLSEKNIIISNWYNKIKIAQISGYGYGQIGHYNIDSLGYYSGTMGGGQGQYHSLDTQMPSTSSEDPIGKEERLWEWVQVDQEFKEHWGVDKVKAWPNDDIYKVRICLVCKHPLSPKHIKRCSCEGCPFKKFKNKSIEWLKANPPEKLLGDIEKQGRYPKNNGNPYSPENFYWPHNRGLDDMTGASAAGTSGSTSYKSGYDALYKWNDKMQDNKMYPSMLGGTASNWYKRIIISRSSVPLVNEYDDKRKRRDTDISDLTTNRVEFGEDIYSAQDDLPIGEKREPPVNPKDEPEYFQEKNGQGITEKLLRNPGSKGSNKEKNIYDEISEINPGSRGISVKEISEIVPKKHKRKNRNKKSKITTAQVNIDEMWGNLFGDVQVEGVDKYIKDNEIEKQVHDENYDLEKIKRNKEVKNTDKNTDIVSFVHKIYSAVVIQTTKNNKKSDKVGGGFFINENMLVTCNHVIFDDTGNAIIWLFKNEKPYKASIVVADNNLDIAVLKLENNFEHEIIKFDIENEVKQGDPVVTIGTPLGYQGVVTFGTITLEKVENKDYAFMDCDIAPGNSGGPVINVKNQKCIGMAVSILKDIEKIGSGLNLILGIKTIIEFLKKNNIKYFV